MISIETKKKHLIFILFASILLFSCNKNTDLTPTYIKINSINLQVQTVEGTSSNRITDAWVYINDDIQGVYELPAFFPVLKEGSHTVTIRPGIMSNGIAATRIFYPFFEAIKLDITFVKGTTRSFDLIAKYHPSVQFKWMENFEDGGISLEKTLKSDAEIIKTSQGESVFEGNFSAKMVLDSNKRLFECQTIESFTLPKGGAPVYLEMNYQNNAPLHVGIFAISSTQAIQRAVLVLNPTEIWKKVYINLTNAVSENTNATEYKVFFGMLKYDDDIIIPTAYIDNIKLLHY